MEKEIENLKQTINSLTKDLNDYKNQMILLKQEITLYIKKLMI